VYDTARVAIAVASSDISPGEVVNAGSNVSYSVQELAEAICKILGHSEIEIIQKANRLSPMDVESLQCNNEKIKTRTGWQPTWSLERGLDETIQWYVDNGKRWTWEEWHTEGS
jgi:nucleoside-diphosphate-sugar epimerase